MKDTKIAKLVHKDKTPNDVLIAILESLLKNAKSGWVTEAAIVVHYSDGDTGSVFSIDNPKRILGELRILDSEIIELC